LFDPQTENPAQPPFLSWIVPSPDGRTLAVGICVDGSERNTIRLIDVAGGHVLTDPPPQTLMDNFAGGVQWLAASSGFFFVRLVGSASAFEQRLFLHRRGSVAPETAQLEVPWITAQDYRAVVVSSDGRYAVALERLMNPIPVAIAEI